GGAGRVGALAAVERGGGGAVRGDPGAAEEQARLVCGARPGDPGGDRGDDDGGAPAVPDGQGGAASVSGDQRQRFGDQVEVRQPLWLPGEPGRRDPAGDRRDDGGQGGGGGRLWRCRQGLGGELAERRG